MIVRAIDNQNDWTFGKGRNNYKRLNDAIAQNIKTRLQSFLGDCFFAQAEGIDWFNLLGAKDNTELSLSIATTILNTQDVTRLIDFEFNVDENRNALIRYDIETIYGRNTNNFQINIEEL